MKLGPVPPLLLTFFVRAFADTADNSNGPGANELAGGSDDNGANVASSGSPRRLRGDLASVFRDKFSTRKSRRAAAVDPSSPADDVDAAAHDVASSPRKLLTTTTKPTNVPTRKPTKIPTAAPTFAAWSGGGCPGAYAQGTFYNMGDIVAFEGLVYKCKSESAAAALWCGMIGYEPKEGIAWEQAWERLGSCSGSIGPTTSPNYSSLPDFGGCPGSYVAKAVGDSYGPGDTVSANGLVFECNPFPLSAHCSQLGFEPLVDFGAPGAWKIAWTVKGYCDGTMNPTSAPNFASLGLYAAGCPQEYMSNLVYNAGDKVALTVSSSPKRTIVYECKQWPSSAYCRQSAFAPGVDPKASDKAWEKKGYCDGTIAPTSSPVAFQPKPGKCVFQKCKPVADSAPVCNEFPIVAYSSAKPYEEGDRVRIGAEKFKCKPYPFSSWCNNDAYAPKLESGIWTDAWSKDGTCEASIMTRYEWMKSNEELDMIFSVTNTSRILSRGGVDHNMTEINATRLRFMNGTGLLKHDEVSDDEFKRLCFSICAKDLDCDFAVSHIKQDGSQECTPYNGADGGLYETFEDPDFDCGCYKGNAVLAKKNKVVIRNFTDVACDIPKDNKKLQTLGNCVIVEILFSVASGKAPNMDTIALCPGYTMDFGSYIKPALICLVKTLPNPFGYMSSCLTCIQEKQSDYWRGQPGTDNCSKYIKGACSVGVENAIISPAFNQMIGCEVECQGRPVLDSCMPDIQRFHLCGGARDRISPGDGCDNRGVDTSSNFTCPATTAAVTTAAATTQATTQATTAA